MDTGLGREGYSNISQGRIDEILSLKSADRREIFEEAAGISKYRHRKEETEHRLAKTDENLLRIGDKITELELQVEPLRQQAEKAKKYLAYRDELKGLQVTLWLQQLDKLTATARKAEQDFTSANFILRQEHDALDALYRKAESLQQALQQRDLALEASAPRNRPSSSWRGKFPSCAARRRIRHRISTASRRKFPPMKPAPGESKARSPSVSSM